MAPSLPASVAVQVRPAAHAGIAPLGHLDGQH